MDSQLKIQDIEKALLDTIDVRVCAISITGEILTANAEFCQLLGYENLHRFKRLEQLVHPEDAGQLADAIERLQYNAIRESTIQLRMHCMDGRFLPVVVRGARIANADAVSILISPARGKPEDERHLIQNPATDAISVLAGGICHSFNNILSTIIGNAEFALRYELKEGDPAEYSVRQIIKAARRAEFLTRQILVLSRRKEKAPTPINLTPIVKETAKFLKATIPAQINVGLSTKVTSDIVTADPVMVFQFLMNLCTYGMELLGESGGKLKISVSSPNMAAGKQVTAEGDHDKIDLRVTVNRDGLPKDLFSKPAADAVQSNTLETARMIAEDMKGDFNPGYSPESGSYMSLLLPLHGVDLESADVSDSPLSGGEERILFIDDDEQIVEFFERSMSVLGYTVTGKDNSVEALEIFRNAPGDFDLIITDMNMESMSGVQLAEGALSVRPDIPIIICTGFDEMLIQAKAKDLGVSAFIMKPFMMDDMDDLIRSVIRDCR